jgi:glutamate-ammonia-ligase adenylyltransferase
VGAVGQSGLEDTLDIVRRVTAERRFQLGAQLVEGRIDPLVAAEALSDLADAALAVIVPAVAEDYARVHGRIAGGEPLVLALGRYGGRALTHASDLDLVYLFTGDHEALSDGDKPQPASLYFNRLAARLTAALSAPTAAGALYEVDTRLRPWGAKGLLALGLDSFTRYQSEEAEAWEHMALCRARLVAGSAEARAGAEAAIAAILARPRAAEPLRRAVLSMRAEIAAAKRPQGPWDVKLASGGLVDLEFLVHFAQLRSATGFTPRLGDAIAALEAAGELPPGLGAAHDRLTRFLVLLRLAAPQGRPPASFPPAVEAMLARALGAANFPALADELALAKAAVRAAWSAVFGEERRGDGS